MAESSYQRRPGEYVRPARRVLLQDRFPPPAKSYRRFLRGSKHHPHLNVPADGTIIELELVPERHNPWDATALAADLDGHRFGYMFAGDALYWHDTVRAANRAGVALYCRAVTTTNDEGDGAYRSAHLGVPYTEAATVLADEYGLSERINAFINRLSAEAQEALLSQEIWYGTSSETVTALRRAAKDFPEITWTRPAEQRFDVNLPTIVMTYLRNRSRQQERARQETRAAEREQVRLAKAADKARAAEEARVLREQAKRQEEQRHQELTAAIEPLAREGWTARAIAEQLGITAAAVTRIRRDLPNVDPAASNQASARQRRARATEALTMQQQGHTRQHIAAELSVTAETVKALLRDAKFLADPNIDQARLHLADQAGQARARGENKAQFQHRRGLSRSKAMEAWSDADALDLHEGASTPPASQPESPPGSCSQDLT